MRMPTALDSRHERPVRRPAIALPPELTGARDQNDEAARPPRLGGVEQADVRPYAAEREEERQEHDEHRVLEPFGERVSEAALFRQDDAE